MLTPLMLAMLGQGVLKRCPYHTKRRKFGRGRSPRIVANIQARAWYLGACRAEKLLRAEIAALDYRWRDYELGRIPEATLRMMVGNAQRAVTA